MLFKKDSKTPQEKIEYTELNKLVKKMRGTKARRKRNEHIQKVLESGKVPRSANKKGTEKKIYCINRSNGETATDREEILSICADFYQKLYKKVIPGHDNISIKPSGE